MQEDVLIDAVLRSVLEKQQRAGGVKAWSWHAAPDHDGQDAIFVSVLMDDSPDGLRWNRVKGLHDELFASLRDKHPFRWPYIRFALASEAAIANAE